MKSAFYGLRPLTHFRFRFFPGGVKHGFSTSSTVKPSKAFLALQNFERRLNKEEPYVSRLEYIKEGLIHPSYYIFASHLSPNYMTQTENKLQIFKK